MYTKKNLVKNGVDGGGVGVCVCVCVCVRGGGGGVDVGARGASWGR